jgi:predicted DNA-binding transcriptional regulator AlpA
MSKLEQSFKRAFTEREASIYTTIAATTLRQGRCHGDRKGKTPVPKHIKIGRAVRYLKEDLDAFLDQMRSQMNNINGGC